MGGGWYPEMDLLLLVVVDIFLKQDEPKAIGALSSGEFSAWGI